VGKKRPKCPRGRFGHIFPASLHLTLQTNKIMNAKQAAPLLAALPALELIAPPLLIGAAIGLGLVWLFSDDEKQQSEATPANTPDENQRKAEETAVKNPVFRQFPAEIRVKPAAAPVTAARVPVVAPPRVPTVPKVSVPVPAPVVVPVIKTVVQATQPPPIKRKVVTREDMASVFQQGASKLTRTAAVAALKRLGFGKTAAYAALTPDGRFASWLQIASDGIINWTNGHTV
jgi:hypothetical protein